MQLVSVPPGIPSNISQENPLGIQPGNPWAFHQKFLQGFFLQFLQKLMQRSFKEFLRTVIRHISKVFLKDLSWTSYKNISKISVIPPENPSRNHSGNPAVISHRNDSPFLEIYPLDIFRGFLMKIL